LQKEFEQGQNFVLPLVRAGATSPAGDATCVAPGAWA
jgi:hypothetical protein